MPGTESISDAVTDTSPGADHWAAIPDGVKTALAAIDDHKGLATVVLDMRTVSSFTEFMILCNGRSEPQVKAIAKAVEDQLRDNKVKVAHVEGMREGHWILLDYGELVVHVFTPEMREFYQLERLWRDAPMLEVQDGSDG